MIYLSLIYDCCLDLIWSVYFHQGPCDLLLEKQSRVFYVHDRKQVALGDLLSYWCHMYVQ